MSAKTPKPKPERCPAGIIPNPAPHRMIFCQLAAGHAGPHKRGRTTWKNRDAR